MREVLRDGVVRLSGGGCTFEYRRPRAGVVVVTISGVDDGALGTATMSELREDLASFAPLELFIATDPSAGARVPVQEQWTAWFAANRRGLGTVHMLVQSDYMHFTAELVKFLSRTGELIRVYLEPRPFAAAVARAAPGFVLPGPIAS